MEASRTNQHSCDRFIPNRNSAIGQARCMRVRREGSGLRYKCIENAQAARVQGSARVRTRSALSIFESGY